MSEKPGGSPATPTPTSIPVELARMALIVLGVGLPFAIGALAGPRPADVPLEPRYAWVIGTAALVSLAGLAYPLGERGRRITAGFALVPLLHFALSGSSTVAALDVLVVLVASSAAIVIGYVRISRAPAPRWARAAVILVLLLVLPGPHITLGWGLASTTLAPAVTRLFHGSPLVRAGELNVEIPSRDGTTLRGTYTLGRPGAPAILLVHGRSDSRARMVSWADALAARGAHVLRIDLRGHGVSGGVAVTFADREPEDVIAAADWLATQSNVGELHVLGASMGGGAVLAATARMHDRVASTVALCPATDYRQLVEASLPAFPPAHAMATFLIFGVTHGLGHRAPLELIPADLVVEAGPTRVLVVHSRSDRTIPPAQTESLAERAPWVEVEWIDGVSHNDTPGYTAEDAWLRGRIQAFLGLRD